MEIKKIILIIFTCRHSTATAGNDIDAAAMEFERRFHISVDASEDREQQVDKCIPMGMNNSATFFHEINFFSFYLQKCMFLYLT